FGKEQIILGSDSSIIVQINAACRLPSIVQPVSVCIRATRRTSWQWPATRRAGSNQRHELDAARMLNLQFRVARSRAPRRCRGKREIDANLVAGGNGDRKAETMVRLEITSVATEHRNIFDYQWRCA